MGIIYHLRFARSFYFRIWLRDIFLKVHLHYCARLSRLTKLLKTQNFHQIFKSCLKCFFFFFNESDNSSSILKFCDLRFIVQLKLELIQNIVWFHTVLHQEIQIWSCSWRPTRPTWKRREKWELRYKFISLIIWSFATWFLFVFASAANCINVKTIVTGRWAICQRKRIVFYWNVCKICTECQRALLWNR